MGMRLNLPTLLGLSALYHPEKAEFTNLSEYHSIGHLMLHTRKQKIFGYVTSIVKILALPS